MTEQTTQFSSLGIKAETKSFTGNRIDIGRLFDREIIMHDFKIGPSKFPEKGTGKRLDIQISIDGIMHVTWTGSGCLQDMIQQIPKSAFPVKTIIKKENGGGYKFT